jgi:peptide methionine sulfoxide reductase msrA/msrB
MVACQESGTNNSKVNTNPDSTGLSDDKLEYFSSEREKALVAGGCFWCIEQPFESIDGVVTAVSGYAGGDIKNPTYSQVSGGETNHRESVQITFDPQVISYSEILTIFFKQYDPTDAGGSFADRGFQYTSAIFYRNDEQKQVAEAFIQQLSQSGIYKDSIVTPVIQYTNFYKAEDYHQNYFKKNPDNYWSYKEASGRVAYIENTWGKIKADNYPVLSKEKIQDALTDLQYRVTQQDGTEKPFDNKYWDNKVAGIYVDIVSGEPLFSSMDKYKSGTGWPSFTKPIDPRYLDKVIDDSGVSKRLEVRSRFADSHLGHVFYDGPEPTQLRYCMNSAALDFIPKAKMKEKGYEKFIWLVK